MTSRAQVRELSAQGVAVLLSSHLIGELENVCDSYTVLRQGRVVWAGTAADLRAQAPTSAYVLTHGRRRPGDRDRRRATPAVRIGRARDGSLAIAARGCRSTRSWSRSSRPGVAIRRLDLLVSPLESMFFALTSDEVTSEMEPIELAEQALAAS